MISTDLDTLEEMKGLPCEWIASVRHRPFLSCLTLAHKDKMMFTLLVMATILRMCIFGIIWDYESVETCYVKNWGCDVI